MGKEDGKWVTIKGTHVFIPEGKRVSEVLRGKWGLNKDKVSNPKGDIRKYDVKLKHDKGKINLSTVASSQESAKKSILNAEHAPESAILGIKDKGSVFRKTNSNKIETKGLQNALPSKPNMRDQNDYTNPTQEQEIERQRMISELRQLMPRDKYLDFVEETTKREISNEEIRELLNKNKLDIDDEEREYRLNKAMGMREKQEAMYDRLIDNAESEEKRKFYQEAKDLALSMYDEQIERYGGQQENGIQGTQEEKDDLKRWFFNNYPNQELEGDIGGDSTEEVLDNIVDQYFNGEVKNDMLDGGYSDDINGLKQYVEDLINSNAGGLWTTDRDKYDKLLKDGFDNEQDFNKYIEDRNSKRDNLLGEKKIRRDNKNSSEKVPRAVGAKDFSDYGISPMEEWSTDWEQEFSDYLRDKYGTDDIDIITTGSEHTPESLEEDFMNNYLSKKEKANVESVEERLTNNMIVSHYGDDVAYRDKDNHLWVTSRQQYNDYVNGKKDKMGATLVMNDDEALKTMIASEGLKKYPYEGYVADQKSGNDKKYKEFVDSEFKKLKEKYGNYDSTNARAERAKTNSNYKKFEDKAKEPEELGKTRNTNGVKDIISSLNKGGTVSDTAKKMGWRVSTENHNSNQAVITDKKGYEIGKIQKINGGWKQVKDFKEIRKKINKQFSKKRGK